MNAGGVPNACKSNGRVLAIRLSSGKRVSNTWAIYLQVGNNEPKGSLIPHDFERTKGRGIVSLEEEPAIDQVVGEVTAHQADDR